MWTALVHIESPWLRTALTEAAHAASRTSDSYLGAHFRVIRGRRGVAKAIGAVRHDILIAFWHIVPSAPSTSTSAPIGTSAATHPNNRPDGSSGSWNGSATPSPSNSRRQLTS